MNVKLVFFIIPSIAFSQLNDIDSKITLNKNYRGIASVDCIAVNYFDSKEVGFKEKKEIIQYDHYLKIISTAFETQQEGKEKRHFLISLIQKDRAFYPVELCLYDRGQHINAHGRGIFFHESEYYWHGEYKGKNSNAALIGGTCYSFNDLYNWKNEGIALPVVMDDTSSPIAKGCIIRAP